MKVIKVIASVLLTTYVIVGGSISALVMLLGAPIVTALKVGFAWPAYPWLMGYIK